MRSQAEIQERSYKAGYLFEVCYFGTIMGSVEIAKIKCLWKIPALHSCLICV